MRPAWTRCFDARFLDNALILIWYSLLTIVCIGAFGATFPSAAAYVTRIITLQQFSLVLVMCFLVVSAIRLCVNKGITRWLVPGTYMAMLAIYGTVSSWGFIKPPDGGLMVGAALPAFFLLMVEFGWFWIWAKIRPRRKTHPLPKPKM